MEDELVVARGVGRSLSGFNEKQERLRKNMPVYIAAEYGELPNDPISKAINKSNAGHLSLDQIEHAIRPTEEQLESERKLIEFMNEPYFTTEQAYW